MQTVAQLSEQASMRNFCGHGRCSVAILSSKPSLQLCYCPVLLKPTEGRIPESSQCAAIHALQPHPKIRVVFPEFTQFINALEWAAPTGTSVVDFVKAAPIKTMLIADLKGVLLCNAPFNQGVSLVFDAVGFICGNANVMNGLSVTF